ncbi:nickel-dependent hydrogenase large subunit [Alisedimentitalea sp. MJ-SS2]|uniref:nickel-dependent hydrogenase large subunit n=1 Tax=Aliisedimentitalea sp. MJ-SS2 TaxID=3049795 RepID=UPI0029106AC1|nr:nickel-dependent hydrogenase large subunit [Alisedimentitalea sp. MJ-SS2]MDU8929663.1 nickel-dependent hydrogenase large subunit [Alisedimentitalea sp. MJ-SS2]
MSRLVVGPFNRVEGDLEVKLDIANQVVTRAEVVSPLYRGFEEMLRGKDPRDALVIVPRICGICSVSQSIAAAEALGEAQGLLPTPNGQLVTNIVHAAENIADHLTHFYMFFMPDFARTVYVDQPWYVDVSDRFAAMKGSAAQDVLPRRAEFFHIVGLLAGKWPHTLAVQPGGVTKTVAEHELRRLLALLRNFRRFLEREVIGIDLQAFSALTSRDELLALVDQQGPTHSDLFRFIDLSHGLGLNCLGGATDRFLSFGAYRHGTTHLFGRGLYLGGQNRQLNSGLITEDLSHAWMNGPDAALHPFDGVTETDPEMADGYSWCKAPRLEGKPAEVGALSRQVVAGHPLARDLVKTGGNVEARILARFLEIALLVPTMENWLNDIRTQDSFMTHASMPDNSTGAGLVEAARGALGHWLTIEDGKIANYQIIAPTTWNFSPRDQAGQPGPLEMALVGAEVQNGETGPVTVQHIVRSFDPCMVCTVH